MNCSPNIITANFSGGRRKAKTAWRHQWDHGQVLCVTGIDDLPLTFTAHFSVHKEYGAAQPVEGIDGQVTIPDLWLTFGKTVYCWIYITDGESGETVYTITIPVIPRPMPEYYEMEDTGVFDGVVAEVSGYAESANDAATRAAASAEAAARSASAAAESATVANTAEQNAAQSASGASTSATAANTAKDAAEAAQTATENAKTAAVAAQRAAETAAGDAQTAASAAYSASTFASRSASEAQDYASRASLAESNAMAYASSASSSADIADNRATAATNAAQTATTKAGEASASADAAAASETAAQTAQQGAEAAETNAGQSASTATTKAAEAAQSASGAAASETAAEAAATRAEQAAASLTVDDALSDTSVNPVQNKVITGEVTQLKSAIDYEDVKPVNWLNLDAVTDGILKANGTTEQSTTRYYTDYIPVKPGDVVRQYYNTNTTYRYNLCAYDSNKSVVTSAGSDSSSSGGYTVPNGISYVRLTLSTTYRSNTMVTVNAVPTAYTSYFAPYIVYNRDLLTAETKGKIDGIPTDIADVTVKGTNLVPAARDGVGAYVAQSGTIKFFASYTTYHYVITPVKPNTRYYVNFGPMWWILTDDNDTIIQSGTSLVPTLKKYIDTGSATKLYYTVSKNNWDVGLIIAEGATGTAYNLQKPGFLNGLNQLMFDGWYALAVPKNKIRFTNGIVEKFYRANMLSLPDKNTLYFRVNTYAVNDNDDYLITPPSARNFNNYLYTVYDDNLSIVEQNVNGQFGSISNDNVQDCSVLLLGDSTIEQGYIGQDLINEFTSRGKTVTLLGTRGSGSNKNEGRSGWSARRYCSVESSGGVTNPFYNPTTQAFDFSYYMGNQGYASVDFVVIQLGINDLYNVTLDTAKESVATLIEYMSTIIQSIKAFNANQKILLNLPTPCTSDASKIAKTDQKFIRAKFIYYNALMQVLHTGFADTRTTHCHLILDPATDINDTIHPNASGYSKMALEILSQINCWQNGN